MTGSVLEHAPNFDPSMLPHVDWPISPTVERAIHGVISEAIDARLSLRDAYASVRAALEQYGIVLPAEEDPSVEQPQTTWEPR